MPPRRIALLALLFPMLLAAKCGKKPVDEVTDPRGAGELASPSVELQVAGIEPSFAPAGKAFAAEVFGNDFEPASRVLLSGSPVASQDYRGEAAIAVQVPALAPGFYDVTVENPDGTRATLRKGLTISAEGELTCSPATVRFEYDSATLGADVRAQLAQVAECLRQTSAPARIEGHCDERGTTDYNLALGQRRAEAVQRYLLGLGVSPARLSTISYGEERPADSSGTSEGLAQNRRVEIVPRGG